MNYLLEEYGKKPVGKIGKDDLSLKSLMDENKMDSVFSGFEKHQDIESIVYDLITYLPEGSSRVNSIRDDMERIFGPDYRLTRLTHKNVIKLTTSLFMPHIFKILSKKEKKSLVDNLRTVNIKEKTTLRIERTCSVCWRSIDDIELPNQLFATVCSHTICSECAIKNHKMTKGKSANSKCPVCRKPLCDIELYRIKYIPVRDLYHPYDGIPVRSNDYVKDKLIHSTNQDLPQGRKNRIKPLPRENLWIFIKTRDEELFKMPSTLLSLSNKLNMEALDIYSFPNLCNDDLYKAMSFLEAVDWDIPSFTINKLTWPLRNFMTSKECSILMRASSLDDVALTPKDVKDIVNLWYIFKELGVMAGCNLLVFFTSAAIYTSLK